MLFKRTYPKHVPAPEYSGPVDWDAYFKELALEEERIRNEGIFKSMIRKLFGLMCLVVYFIAYIPVGLYSLLCGGYFFGATLAGGQGLDMREIEEDLTEFEKQKAKKEEGDGTK